MPVFIVSTNLQLVVGLLVGKCLFGKTFIFSQYMGVGLITVGCLVITYASDNKEDCEATIEEGDVTPHADMLFGFLYMMISLASISIMIPLGSKCVQQYDADVQEHIFIQHFLALPLFLYHWESKIFPIVKKIMQSCSHVIVFGEHVKIDDTVDEYPSIGIPIFGTSIEIRLPTVMLLLISTTVFAQINRHSMIEVSIATSSFTAQLIGNLNKIGVFLISSLYLNAPPYPPWITWIGLCIQVYGSYVYVQTSFSEASTSDGSSSSFKPNTNSNRLARVSWTGDWLYDSRLLGLSRQELAYLRKATAKHNNRGLLVSKNITTLPLKATFESIPEEKETNSKSIDVPLTVVTDDCNDHENQVGGNVTASGSPLPLLSIQRTVSDVPMHIQAVEDSLDIGDVSFPSPSTMQRRLSLDSIVPLPRKDKVGVEEL
jgi:hypothetical protein